MLASIFLLPNGTWFVELAVFVIIVLIAYKWIIPPINKMIEARQEKIRTALEAAEAARAEAAAADDERARVLTQAREQAQRIVAEAQEVADQVRAGAGERGQAEYDRIVAAAHAEVAQARERAVNEASARIGEVVFSLVNQIVGREVDRSTHEGLVREAVAALNAEASAGSDA